QRRIAPVGPQRDVGDDRRRRDVLEREERRRGRRFQIDFKIRQEQCRRRLQGDVATIVVVRRRRRAGSRRVAPRRGGEEQQGEGECVSHGVGFGAGAICAPTFGDGEQPLPRATAVASVAYVGSANIDVITQFWLWRRPIVVLLFVRKSRAIPGGTRPTL